MKRCKTATSDTGSPNNRKKKVSQKLDKIQKVMEELRRLAQSKNDVEAHIFETRDMLEYNDELKAVMSDEQMDELRSGLSAAEEWLWDDHSYSEYVEKVFELRDALKPALTRKEEAASRPEALQAAKQALTNVRDKLSNETYMQNMPINETNIIESKTDEFSQWVDEQELAQSKRSASEEPAFMTSELVSKTRSYEKAMAAAMAKKPKPKKDKKEPESSKSEDIITSSTDDLVWNKTEHLQILKHFYATAAPQENKTDEDIQAIIDKRTSDDADELRPAQFNTLCRKLENRYDIHPVSLWLKDHPRQESGEPSDEQRADEDKQDQKKEQPAEDDKPQEPESSWSSWFGGGSDTNTETKDKSEEL